MWLIKYEGGGYDGCIWENNYFVCDDPYKITVFHNIYASGFRGIKNLIELWAKGKPKEWYHYDLSAKGWEVFCANVTAAQAYMVGKVLKDIEIVNPTMQCSECKNNFALCDLQLPVEYWYGIGGIATDCDTILCQVCYEKIKHNNLVEFVLRGIEELWDKWPEYEDYILLSDDDQLKVIEYAICSCDTSNEDSIIEWIMENYSLRIREMIGMDEQLTLL